MATGDHVVRILPIASGRSTMNPLHHRGGKEVGGKRVGGEEMAIDEIDLETFTEAGEAHGSGGEPIPSEGLGAAGARPCPLRRE